jgi:hypothetical protein
VAIIGLGDPLALINRRIWLSSFAFASLQKPDLDKADSGNKDWLCPMDPEVRSAKTGLCPKCGMQLVLTIPERVEYLLELTTKPALLKPGHPLRLTFRIRHPDTNKIVTAFDIVHEKLLHVFLISENLEFFAHEHPVLQPGGSFTLNIVLPLSGMYRLLADFYPTGSVPQLALNTLFVTGNAPPKRLTPSLQPSKAANLTATLRTEPEELLAGLESRLTFSLAPAAELQPYLGAWGHMLAASKDLIDLLHIHPFLVKDSDIQFNIVFPRPGIYRVWTQFQRAGIVNTTVFTLSVKAL